MWCWQYSYTPTIVIARWTNSAVKRGLWVSMSVSYSVRSIGLVCYGTCMIHWLHLFTFHNTAAIPLVSQLWVILDSECMMYKLRRSVIFKRILPLVIFTIIVLLMVFSCSCLVCNVITDVPNRYRRNHYSYSELSLVIEVELMRY